MYQDLEYADWLRVAIHIHWLSSLQPYIQHYQLGTSLHAWFQGQLHSRLEVPFHEDISQSLRAHPTSSVPCHESGQRDNCDGSRRRNTPILESVLGQQVEERW